MRIAILIIASLNAAWLVFSVIQYPRVLRGGGLSGLVADAIILLLYGYLALLSPISIGKTEDGARRLGASLGLISGFVLSADLISGYVFPNPALSATTSYFSYGTTILLIVIAGVVGAKGGKVKSGMAAAVWCVLVALLIWFFVEFAAYVIFSNTGSGAAFLRDEMQSDFISSGATDYRSFVLSDLYGAGFFHLLLGLMAAAMLGLAGALAGKMWHSNQSLLGFRKGR